MENNIKKDAVIHLIQENKVYGKITKTDQAYSIGDRALFITVQCKKNGDVISAHCTDGVRFAKFVLDEASSISAACKNRLLEQKTKSR